LSDKYSIYSYEKRGIMTLVATELFSQLAGFGFTAGNFQGVLSAPIGVQLLAAGAVAAETEDAATIAAQTEIVAAFNTSSYKLRVPIEQHPCFQGSQESYFREISVPVFAAALGYKLETSIWPFGYASDPPNRTVPADPCGVLNLHLSPMPDLVLAGFFTIIGRGQLEKVLAQKSADPAIAQRCQTMLKAIEQIPKKRPSIRDRLDERPEFRAAFIASQAEDPVVILRHPSDLEAIKRLWPNGGKYFSAELADGSVETRFTSSTGLHLNLFPPFYAWKYVEKIVAAGMWKFNGAGSIDPLFFDGGSRSFPSGENSAWINPGEVSRAESFQVAENSGFNRVISSARTILKQD
jgi:hypothetical protein